MKTVGECQNSLDRIQNIVEDHGCIYYGKSYDGTIYVYTKNGDGYPKIMKLNDLFKISEYGSFIGIGGGSGFYLFNK